MMKLSCKLVKIIVVAILKAYPIVWVTYSQLLQLISRKLNSVFWT
jgi:hypothetical protein